jgi:ankyrin repeat protein
MRSPFESFSRLGFLRLAEHNPEIDNFITQELQRFLEAGSLAVNDPLLILDIQKSLSKRAQGMFLWVALQIKALCLERTDAGIRQAIKNLPTHLSDIYQTILKKAGATTASRQAKIFNLLGVACRPLTTDEIREALSVVPGDTAWNSQNIVNDIYSTLACCGGLIIIDEDDLGIRMIHHSVMTFLHDRCRGLERFDRARANGAMAEIILTYFSYEEVSRSLSTVKAPTVHGKSIAFAVTRSAAGPLRQSQRLALKLLRANSRADKDIGPALLSALGQWKSETPSFFYQYADPWWPEHLQHLDYTNPVFASLFVRLLRMVDPNRCDSNGRTLLSYAAQSGYDDIVVELLANGAQDIQDSSQQMPLMYAITAGHAPIVQDLLDSDVAQPNATDRTGRCPLHLAVMADDHRILKSLFKWSKLDPNTRDSYGQTPLTLATANGYLKCVLLLLESPGVDMRPDNNGNTPLHAAALGGDSASLCDKIAEKTDMNIVSKNSEGQTPFWLAAVKGRSKIIMYLGKYPGINIRDNDGVPPLIAAAQNGHAATVRILLDKPWPDPFGASDWVVNNEGSNALALAANNGHLEVVNILVALGPKMYNHGNKMGQTPIWLAAAKGHFAIASVLLSARDISESKVDLKNRTPL